MKPKWIGIKTGYADCKDKYGAPSPILKTVFDVKEGLKGANIRISSLGLFCVFINGEKVANDYLLPEWTDFNRRVFYYEYDITRYLKYGKNSVAVILGDGYYCGNVGWVGRENYGSYPLKLWAGISLNYDEGSEIINTNEKWRGTKSFIVYSDIINGEMQDGRLKNDRLFSSDFDYGEWSEVQCFYNVKIEPMQSMCAPIRKKEVFDGLKIGSKLIYDFGQNFAGIVKITLESATAGNEIIINYGEMLYDNGDLYRQNLRSSLSQDRYICEKGENIFESYFTYHGFRYVEIIVTGDVSITDVKGIAIHNDVDFGGNFECSDKNVNKLFENVRWSQKSNFIGVPTDCPQRDERLGWTGDAQIFCDSAMYNADCKDFFRKYLQDIRDAQYENGMIDSVAPKIMFNLDDEYGAPGWGDAIVIIPYIHYIFYGDKAIIFENLQSGKRWLDYCLSDSEGMIRNWRGYGDWLNYNDSTDNSLLGTLYMGYSARLIAEMCKIIDDSECIKYFQLWEKIKQAFLKRFKKSDGTLSSDSQTAYLLAYNFGFVGDEIKENILKTLERNNGRLSCGFLGVKYLLPTLSRLGLNDYAYRLICSTEYPSWCYPVVNGATTVWERWNSYSAENGFGDIGMNSFNHYALGSCIAWMYKYVLGITVDGINNQIIIDPYPDFSKQITYAKGQYKYQGKQINVEWKLIKEDCVEYIVRNSGFEVKYKFNNVVFKKITDTNDQVTFLLTKM